MQKFFYLLTVILISSVFSNQITAQDSTKNVTEDQIEESLLNGAKSENEGLRISSSYYLGETQISAAVIPLMDILHNDKSPEARMMAALSLFKLGDERGIFAVKNAAKSDENEQVRKMCGIFYNMYLTEQSGQK